MPSNRLAYFREFLTEFKTTGTICATSKWAASAMIEPIRATNEPVNILEVGPGTGSVTIPILREMQPNDRLTICEINPRLMQKLKLTLEENPDFVRLRDRVSFVQGPIQELEESDKFQIIICALPFLNFELEMVEEIFVKLRRLCSEEAFMTYYEYIGIRSLSCSFSPPKRKERLRQLDQFFERFFTDNLEEKKLIWLNFLPIYVYTLRLPHLNGTNPLSAPAHSLNEPYPT